MALIVPATVFGLIYVQPVTELVYGRGAFLQADVEKTSMILGAYILGIFGMVLREAYARYFYVHEKFTAPVLNAFGMLLLNLLLSLWLGKYWGVLGIALGTSLSTLLAAVFLAFQARVEMGAAFFASQAQTFLRILGAALLAAAVSYGLYGLLRFCLRHEAVLLLVAFLIGGLLYLLFMWMQKMPELAELQRYLKRRKPKEPV